MTTFPHLRSPLKYIGGKSASAARIVAAFPPRESYSTYVEPCGGAAHVLLYKPSWGHREVYNDLNDDLVNFWRQMQQHADQLVQRLEVLPYSRAFYYDFYTRLFDGSVIDPLERAVMWFYVLRSTGTGWIRETPVGWNNTVSNARSYRSALEVFSQVQLRLTNPPVVLENHDFEYVLATYDSPTTLYYCDPPYIGAEYYYQVGARKQSKRVFEHQRLAAMLNQVQGLVALSYYPHQLLDTWYPPDRWSRLIWKQHKPSALSEEAEKREATELLLCNYPAFVPSQLGWESGVMG